jgi:hypothetical protein
MTLPGLAADDVARLLTTNVKRPDGKDATAFNSQAKALKAMRELVIELEADVAALKEAPPVRPFP